MSGFNPKQRKSLYVTAKMVGELKQESARIDRSESWLLQYVWDHGKEALKKIPTLEMK